MGEGHYLVVEIAPHDDDKKDVLKSVEKIAARRIRQTRLPHVGGSNRNLILTFLIITSLIFLMFLYLNAGRMIFPMH